MVRTAVQILLAAVGDQRVKSLVKKHPELAEGIQTLADADPSDGQQKYLQWATNKLKAGADLEEVGNAVQAFHETKKLLKEKDLNRYKTPEDVIQESEKAVKEEADSKKSELVYSKDDVHIYQVHTKAQMCEIGEGSKWCVSEPEGTYWDREYTNKPGWEFYVIESEGEKYLAYVVGGVVRELRDWWDDEANEMARILLDAKLVHSIDVELEEDEEERSARMFEEAYECASAELTDEQKSIANDKSKHIFDEYMEGASEEFGDDTYWGKAWKKYVPWATQRITAYFEKKLRGDGDYRGTDEWGFRDVGWDFEWDSDYDDHAYGWFSGKEEPEVYAKILVLEFLKTQMGWKEDDGNPPGWDDSDYQKPWEELVENAPKAARVAAQVIREN